LTREYAIYLTLVWTLGSQCLFSQTSPLDGDAYFVTSIPELGTHLVQPDGERLIYYNQGAYIAPRISPDGNQLLLHSRRGGRIGIWLGSVDRKELRRLCDGDQANWSPSGEKLVFRRGGRILERDLATGEEKHISPPGFSASRFPSYLSEGRLLFVSQDSIYITARDSGSVRILASGEIRSAPRASPKAPAVVWQSGAHLMLLDLDSGKPRRLTTQGGIQSWPVWSEDGKYIAYCQSPLPEGPWDLYVTAAENPEKTWLIRRGIHPGFDWTGEYFPDSDPTEIVRGELSVLKSSSPSNGQQHQWNRVVAKGKPASIQGDVRIENTWLAGSLSSESDSFSLSLREGPAATRVFEISPFPSDGVPGEVDTAIQLEYHEPEEVQLNLLYSSAGSPPVSINLTMPAYRPFIELKCEGTEVLSIGAASRLVLIPDRLGNDILLDPETCRSSRSTLPYTPLLLAPLGENSGLIVIVTPERSQTIELRSGPSFFEEILLSPGVHSVFVAILPGSDRWQELEVRATDQKERWQADWTQPFLAQWRIAARGEESGYSRMWGEESLSLRTNSFLPIDASLGASPRPAVMYLFGRSWHTPLHVITLLDSLIDAVGLDKGFRLLDEQGIRSYRVASSPVSFRQITTRAEEWSRELVHVDSRDPNWVQLGVLESMQGLRATDTPGVRSVITHFGKDIVSILDGLDNRIREYTLFLDHLRRFCRLNQSSSEEVSAYCTAVIQQADVLEARVEQKPVSAISPLEEAISEILGALGSSKYLHSTEEYARLSKIVRTFQDERLEVIREYREFVKTVRNKSARAVIDAPGLETVGNELRKMTADVLRNRYFLEGDWNGEVPLGKETD